ncbi:Serine/threonine-protein phosphatase 2A regulatory subunit B'' subunit alpha [Coemansia sp. RSA 2703]|nr:Serine/threonine-protein phosphatase 2A regulatory subunit B'' subunit alpha [Coemansia sp. RSA 2703]KAJ2377882.1 Serine/threonine-protein phosphatase 2A regulatory subunit B'' subunit alpha [Coemansia sp. RSA 2607]KAJ2398108.1 Serine/threonine-protein phosphatase 2A regulatory subunit B'' subunit alpha [Coemansia sp. RSA 2603]
MGSTTANVSAMSTPQKKPGSAQHNQLLSSPILQADELSLNPRWSPQLKSPPPNSTISSRLRQQNSPLGKIGAPQSLSFSSDKDVFADSNLDDITEDTSGPPEGVRNINPMASPLNKRARILQTNSPESLPPLSPVVSNRKRALRGDMAQDSSHPFSPTASGLRIRYSPSSPVSPSLRAKSARGEPESPTPRRMLSRVSTALSLGEKVGESGAASDGGIEDDSPTVSQMSRSLLFRLDLQSPTARRGMLDSDEGSMSMDQSPTLSTDASGFQSPTPPDSLNQPNSTKLATDDISAIPVSVNVPESTPVPMDEAVMQRRQPIMLRRPTDISRTAAGTASLGSKNKQSSIDIGAAISVPRLYVSLQHPRKDAMLDKEIRQQLERARRHFDRNFGAREADFIKVTEACGLPRFANRALFNYSRRDSSPLMTTPSSANTIIGKRSRHIDIESWPSYSHFCNIWSRLRRSSADISAILFNILVDDETKPRSYLTREDIRPLVTDVVDHHYELEFLEGQDHFSQSYTDTVIERIFYIANRSWDGKMTLSQFRRADIVGILRSVEEGIDVDMESPGVFSYKHFYVLFCSFFELDHNRDKLLDARDLLRYFSGTLSRRIISRIMMGKGRPSEHQPTRLASSKEGLRTKSKVEKLKGNSPYSRYDLNVRLSSCRMTYNDFIWFILSEIDKTSPTAIEYWFRCLDLDGDGVLSLYELEYFYDEQMTRMEESVTGDIVIISDLMCQLSDMVRPEREGMFTLKDLRRAPPSLMPMFFDAFMNLNRFVEHETRTSFLQRQLAQMSQRALPTVSFKDVIQLRMDFLASLPNPWVEFADMEYAALLNDNAEQEAGANNTSANTDANVSASVISEASGSYVDSNGAQV